MNDYYLSIIIPAYNCEKYINECIQSIIKQKNDFVEIILINDGSTDTTLEKCEEFVKKFPNIKLINQENKGVSYSRNIGIKNANGKYIMFLDSDDYLEEKSLEDIQELLSDNIDVLRYSYIIKNKNKKERTIFSKEEFNLSDDKKCFFSKFFQQTNQNMIWGQAIKKELLNNITFNEKIFYGEDLLFNYQLYSKCKNIKYTDKILYNYNQNMGSITTNYKNTKVKSKIENLIYVFGKIMSGYEDMNLIKTIENKFLGEIVPQIMMLTFDKEVKKNQVILELQQILNNDIFEKVFKDIDEKELTMCKYPQVYKSMKNKDIKKIYLYAQIYKKLKMIQQFLKIAF